MPPGPKKDAQHRSQPGSSDPAPNPPGARGPRRGRWGLGWGVLGPGLHVCVTSPMVPMPACPSVFTEGLSCPGHPTRVRFPQSLMPQTNQEPITRAPQTLLSGTQPWGWRLQHWGPRLGPHCSHPQPRNAPSRRGNTRPALTSPGAELPALPWWSRPHAQRIQFSSPCRFLGGPGMFSRTSCAPRDLLRTTPLSFTAVCILLTLDWFLRGDDHWALRPTAPGTRPPEPRVPISVPGRNARMQTASPPKTPRAGDSV